MHGHRVLTSLPGRGDRDARRTTPGGAAASASSCATSAARSAAAASATAPRTGVQGEFALFAVGIAPDAAGGDGRRRRPHPPHRRAASPWDAGRALLNFTDRPARFFDGYTVHRLRALKAQLDGDGMFAGRA